MNAGTKLLKKKKETRINFLYLIKIKFKKEIKFRSSLTKNIYFLSEVDMTKKNHTNQLKMNKKDKLNENDKEWLLELYYSLQV